MILNLLTIFNDFFQVNYQSITTSNSLITNLNNGGYFINLCFFLNFLDRGILFSGGIVQIVIENCLFSNLNPNSLNGGAILFNSNEGEIVLNKNCGYDCKTTGSNSYGFFMASNSKNNGKNEIYFTTTSNCIVENPLHEQASTFIIGSGNIIQRNNNISKSKTRSYTSFLIYSCINSDLKYLNIINTITTVSSLLEVQSMDFNSNYFNIVNHSQSSSYYIFTHHYSGISKLFNFIILDCTTSINHQLFYGSHELINCFINIGQFNGISFTNILTINTNTFKIEHFSTIFCLNNFKNEFSKKKINLLIKNYFKLNFITMIN